MSPGVVNAMLIKVTTTVLSLFLSVPLAALVMASVFLASVNVKLDLKEMVVKFP